jgi:hypothetical protein
MSSGPFYERVKHLSRRGPADRLGELGNISPARVAAASSVRLGRAVSLAAPMDSQATRDNPDPAVHEMTHTPISSGPGSGLSFAMDRVAMNIHGNADSHIDALSHVIFDGTLYNGVSADASHRRGRLSSPLRWLAAGSSAAACCSTSRGCGGAVAGAG